MRIRIFFLPRTLYIMVKLNGSRRFRLLSFVGIPADETAARCVEDEQVVADCGVRPRPFSEFFAKQRVFIVFGVALRTREQES